jgi:hypothetical protein
MNVIHLVGQIGEVCTEVLEFNMVKAPFAGLVPCETFFELIKIPKGP